MRGTMVRQVTTEAEEEEEKDADAELKPRTPHRDVGKKGHASILFQHLATLALNLSDSRQHPLPRPRNLTLGSVR